MKTDILFIHPGNHRRTYQDLSGEFTAIATPAWTLLLAGHARNSGLTMGLYDVNVDGWDDSLPAELLERYNPRLIVMMVYGHNPSASTQTMPAARMIARDLKNFRGDILIALGGTHPSALPERTLREEPIDFVIQGEGVYTISDLSRALRSGTPLDPVPGLWFRQGSDCRRGAPPRLVQDLDGELAEYSWDLLPDLTRYRAHTMHCFQYFEKSTRDDFIDVRTPYVALNTSLGCPYSCHYCCINALFDKPGIRYWSVATVLNWLDTLVNRYGVKHIRLDDELFLLNPLRVEEFCDKVISRGYDLNLWVYGRVDTIPDRLLEKMRRAGITWICLGIEAGNEKVRQGVNKNILTDIRQVVASIQARGIHVLGNYMFGLPDDTLETMQETLDLAKELNTEFANFYSVMAYPGSRLYDEAEKIDGALPEGWDGFSQHSYLCQPLPTKHVTAADVLRFRDQAFDEYHSSPRYVEMMKQKFGARVSEHLRRMLTVKLERKLLA
jgi:radical SAM superfamily enzyme YgiQ (UPF0313 family)